VKPSEQKSQRKRFLTDFLRFCERRRLACPLSFSLSEVELSLSGELDCEQVYVREGDRFDGSRYGDARLVEVIRLGLRIDRTSANGVTVRAIKRLAEFGCWSLSSKMIDSGDVVNSGIGIMTLSNFGDDTTSVMRHCSAYTSSVPRPSLRSRL
jgi:hypothetical protein